MRTIYLALFLAGAAACSGGGASDSSGDPGDPTQGGGGGATSADAGVGGVSFGGAQDFGDFREILGSGGIPGPDTLDANGFFNEHYAPPPASGCTNTLCATPGLSIGKDWLTGAHQGTLQIAINTNVDPTQYTRRPLDIVVVVDRSGSMASDGRMDKVKHGLGELIDGLQDGDRMALVSFSDGVTTNAPLATLDRASLHAAVTALVPGGGTDIYDGLAAGFDLLATPTPEREQRLIFLSDGQATVGDTSQDDIFALSDGYISTGIGLTTIGVGADFDVTLMRGLAEHGAGNFYFLENDTAVDEVFTEELGYFMSPIALDVAVNATAGQGYAFGEVVGSTLWTSTPQSGSMHVPAVFVASRTTPTDPTNPGDRRGGGSMLFIALTPTGAPTDEAGTVGTITLTYKLPGGGAPVTQTVTLAYSGAPTDSPDAPYLSAPEIAYRYAMYNLFLGLRAATQNLDVNCASVDLYATETGAKAWNAPHEDTDITADIGLIDEYLANLKAVGATATAATTASTCAYPPGYGDDPDGPTYGGDLPGDDPQPKQPLYLCSAGGDPRGALVVLLGALVAVRRRRR